MAVDTLVVTAADAGQRLDVFLSRRRTDVSRAQLQRMISDGIILLNGAPAVKKQCVTEHDTVTVPQADAALSGAPPKAQNIPIEILYEDDHLLAVNKPAGLVVHPGHGVPDGTLVNALLYREASLSSGGGSPHRPGIVHRLDKQTSGVVLIAKTNTVHFRLAAEFAERNVAKQYVGLCIGRPAQENGLIDLALDRSRRDPIKRAVSAHGKAAITCYETITHRCGISVIRFAPRTGRTHQIRVHCSTAGFPIVADSLYGGDKERLLRINPAERPFAYKVFKCFERHALHALRISFTHPVSGCQMTIQAPLPDDFRNAIRLFNDPEIFKTLEKT